MAWIKHNDCNTITKRCALKGDTQCEWLKLPLPTNYCHSMRATETNKKTSSGIRRGRMAQGDIRQSKFPNWKKLNSATLSCRDAFAMKNTNSNGTKNIHQNDETEKVHPYVVHKRALCAILLWTMLKISATCNYSFHWHGRKLDASIMVSRLVNDMFDQLNWNEKKKRHKKRLKWMIISTRMTPAGLVTWWKTDTR